MIGVDAQQVVGGNVAQVIRRDYHAAADFMLHTDVHLHRTWRDIIRSEQVGSGDIDGVGENVSNVNAIAGRALRQRERLVLLLQLHDLRSYASDRLAADAGGINGAGKRQGLRRSVGTHRLLSQEKSLRKPCRAVKQIVVPD